MTRFIHDQFAKQYLSELLSPLGTVEISKQIQSEGRQIDLLFVPSSSETAHRENLGLLGRLTTTPALFEPFRNPVTASDVRTCMMKLLVAIAELEREAKRDKVSLDREQLPQLWILTPTASAKFLKGFHANASKQEDLDRDDEDLIMTLTQMYEEAMAEEMAEVRQQAKKEGLEQVLERGRGEGKQEATRLLIENIFRVRFGEIDEELAATIAPIMQLSSEEFTPLLLQLSREELIDRFPEKEAE